LRPPRSRGQAPAPARRRPVAGNDDLLRESRWRPRPPAPARPSRVTASTASSARPMWRPWRRCDGHRLLHESPRLRTTLTRQPGASLPPPRARSIPRGLARRPARPEAALGAGAAAATLAVRTAGCVLAVSASSLPAPRTSRAQVEATARWLPSKTARRAAERRGTPCHAHSLQSPGRERNADHRFRSFHRLASAGGTAFGSHEVSIISPLASASTLRLARRIDHFTARLSGGTASARTTTALTRCPTRSRRRRPRSGSSHPFLMRSGGQRLLHRHVHDAAPVLP